MRFSFKKTLATILSIALILSSFVGAFSASAAEASVVGALSLEDVSATLDDNNQFSAVANISLEQPSSYLHVAFTLADLPQGVSLVDVSADTLAATIVNLDNGIDAIYLEGDKAAVSNVAITFTFVAADSVDFTLAVNKIFAMDDSELDVNINVSDSAFVSVKKQQSGEPEELTFNGISRAKSLSLKDVVYVNPVVAFVDVVDGVTCNAIGFDKDYALANGKILFWEVNPGDNAVIGTEKFSSSLEDYGVYKKDGIQEYSGKSMGISARKFADTIYYRTYIVVDGVEYYGDIIEYSVQTYCYNQINKNKQASLCATLLNYGSAAQINFNHNVDNLANAILPGLVEAGKLDAKYLELNFDESVLVAANTPAESMTVNFAQNGAKITSKALSLTGAIEAKITMGYKINGDYATQLPADADLKFYFWTSANYEALAAAGTPLTKENASSVKTYGVGDEVEAADPHAKYGYEYFSKPDPIAARKLGETFYYAAIVTEADGTEYCTGVQGYSPYQYVINQLGKSSVSVNTKNLCRWIAVYGAEAKATLG